MVADMSIWITTVIPAAIIVLSNVFSGHHESRRYELITMCFGLMVLPAALWWMTTASPLAQQISFLCLIAALSRDYEKLLKRLFGRR